MYNLYEFYEKNIDEVIEAMRKQNKEEIIFTEEGYDDCGIMVSDVNGYSHDAIATGVRLSKEAKNDIEILVEEDFDNVGHWITIYDIPWFTSIEALESAAYILGIM